MSRRPGEQDRAAEEIVNGKALAAGRSGSAISSANAIKPLLADGIADNPRLAPCGSGEDATWQRLFGTNQHLISRTNTTGCWLVFHYSLILIWRVFAGSELRQEVNLEVNLEVN